MLHQWSIIIEMSEKNTDELLHTLKNLSSATELDSYLGETEKADFPQSFCAYFNGLLKQKGLAKGEVIIRSGLDRSYAYQILQEDSKKQPGRNKILALCLAAGCSLAETIRALETSGEAILYAKNKRDAILIFSIHKGLSLLDTNELFYEMNEEPLGSLD